MVDLNADYKCSVSEFRYETTFVDQNKDSEIISAAHQSFLGHAAAIFEDPSINPETGETVYADIETHDVFSKLASAVQSVSGEHQAIITVARDTGNKVVGFSLGIYHEASNTANFTYTGVDENQRSKGIGGQLEQHTLNGIDALARSKGHDGVDAIFVEVEDGKDATIQSRVKRGYESALPNWESPLLISDGEGSFQEQEMRLLVQWVNPSLDDAQKRETTIGFTRDFYGLYSNPLLSGGALDNQGMLYPQTDSINYRSESDQNAALNRMRISLVGDEGLDIQARTAQTQNFDSYSPV